MALASSDPRLAVSHMPRFEKAFDDARAALDAQTVSIAASLDAANARTRKAYADARLWLGGAGLSTITLGWIAVALIGRSIRRSLTRLRDVAKDLAAGNLERRSDHGGNDEVGQLSVAVNGMADAL